MHDSKNMIEEILIIDNYCGDMHDIHDSLIHSSVLICNTIIDVLFAVLYIQTMHTDRQTHALKQAAWLGGMVHGGTDHCNMCKCISNSRLRIFRHSCNIHHLLSSSSSLGNNQTHIIHNICSF